jgi:hypothetical protein
MMVYKFLYISGPIFACGFSSVFVYCGPVMTKYRVVCEKNGGWSVIATGKSGEDRFLGFRDEAHARAWIAKKLEKKPLTDTLGVLAR